MNKSPRSQKGFRRQERCSGTFSRSITLPTYVDADKIEAAYEKGVSDRDRAKDSR